MTQSPAAFATAAVARSPNVGEKANPLKLGGVLARTAGILDAQVRVEVTREVRNGDRDRLGRGALLRHRIRGGGVGVGRASGVSHVSSARILGRLDSRAVEAAYGWGSSDGYGYRPSATG